MQNNKTIISLFLVLILLFIYAFPCLSLAEDSIYVWSNSNDSETVQTSSIASEPIDTPASTEPIENNSLNLESASAILIEQSSGQILYSHNIHEQLRPASVTKVMSILLIMEALDSRKNILN